MVDVLGMLFKAQACQAEINEIIMKASTKHQIILIRGPEVESDYGDMKFIESVSNWDEVTTEELDVLRLSQFRNAFRIVERNPQNLQSSLKALRTPRDYIDHYRKELAESKAKADARAKLSEAQLKERKRKQLEKLKKELGEA